MRIHNLYTDASGQSHFRDIEVDWAEETKAGKLSKRLPATGIIFRQVQPTYDLDWHPAPRRQYIINLDAGVQITALIFLSFNFYSSLVKAHRIIECHVMRLVRQLLVIFFLWFLPIGKE